MATIIASQQIVSSTPTRIAMGFVGASWVYLHTPVGGNTVFIGNGDVTVANGFALPKDQLNTFWLPENDQLFAVVASGTATLYVMHSGGR